MTHPACYHLDTRLSAFSATIALEGDEQLLDILAFDIPDDMVRAVAVSLVSHTAGLASGSDLGWRRGDALDEKREARAGERLVLAITRGALMRAVTAHRAQSEADGDPALDIAFSTIVETQLSTRSSPRRSARVTVLAGASQPQWRVEAGEIDLDLPGGGKLLPIGHLAVDLPRDIVLEGRRGLVVEAGCFGLKAQSLVLAVAAPHDHAVTLRRQPDGAGSACRYLLWLSDAAALAGETLRLDMALARDAVLDHVDERLHADRRAPLQIRLTAKLAGWYGQDGAGPEPSAQARTWSSGLEARLIPILSRDPDAVSLTIGGETLPCPLGGETVRLSLGSGLAAEIDPGDETGVVHCGELAVALRHWPVTRTAPLTLQVTTALDGSEIAEAPQQLVPELVRDGDAGRRARTAVAMRALTGALSRRIRSSGAGEMQESLAVTLTLTAGDEPGRPIVQAALPLRFSRRVHRLPVCIDLGASATSIWSGAPRAAGRATEIRPLALGSWLARHVDPGHDEAALQDGGFSPLIPSHIGLDSDNHLRADHAPHTLPDLALIGADRTAVARRLSAFDRRYDVSAPAPPQPPGRPVSGRRVESLKHTLTSGAVAITLPQPVQRRDAASGRVVATTTVEVAPLVADVLDELVDLYLLRLGEDGLRIEDTAPAPVVPRILISCPSGIGDEIAARYRAALELFVQRLERHYPGVSNYPDAAATVPEAVAAARYLASLPEIRLSVPDRGELLLITLDIGGGTSDVALTRLRRDGDRIGHATLATFGLPVGGDTLDETLVEVVAELVDDVMAGQQSHWQPAFAESSLVRITGRQDAAALAARNWLRGAVQKAKAALSARLVAEAQAAQAPYRWTEEATLDLVLAEIAADGTPAGLFVPADEAALAEQPQAAAARLAIEDGAQDGARRLVLRLRREALAGHGSEAGQRLAEIGAVLGGLLPRMARTAAPNPVQRPQVALVPTGRAALWPPLFEAMAAEAAQSRSAFPFPRPFSPAAMKKAVIAGAAILGIENDLAGAAVQHANPLGIAAMAVRMRDLGATGLRTAFAAERIHYLGYDIGSGDRIHAEHDSAAPSLGGRTDLGRRFQFVRTVPGLDPQGRMLARLRPLLDGADPLVVLEGDSIVEAHREGLDGFGLCEIVSEALGPDSRKVTVSAVAEGWEGCWRIEHGRVSRVY